MATKSLKKSRFKAPTKEQIKFTRLLEELAKKLDAFAQTIAKEKKEYQDKLKKESMKPL